MSNKSKVSLVIADRLYKKIIPIIRYTNITPVVSYKDIRIADVLLRQNVINKLLYDIASVIDTTHIDVAKSFYVTTYTYDSISHIDVDKVVNEIVAIIENTNIATNKPLLDTSYLHDTIANDILKIYHDAVSVADALNSNISKVVVDSSIANSYTTISTFKHLLNSLPISDQLLLYVIRSGSMLINENLFNQSTFG